MASRAIAPQPEERRSTEWAYARIRGDILNGALVAGEPLSQKSLAEELGISRTPLREAMRLLQNEGLLEGEPNRRLRVAGVSIEELEQLYAMRIANECLAIRTGAPLMDESHHDAIAASLQAMEDSMIKADVEATESAHKDFHMLLVSSAGSRLRQIAEMLWDHTVRYRSAYLAGAESSAAVAMEAQLDHVQIFEAVRSGDGSAASKTLAEHYSRTAQALIKSSGEDHDPALLRAAAEAAGVQL